MTKLSFEGFPVATSTRLGAELGSILLRGERNDGFAGFVRAQGACRLWRGLNISHLNGYRDLCGLDHAADLALDQNGQLVGALP